MSNLQISRLETPTVGHADQGCRKNGSRPALVQCAVINSRAGEPRDNNRTRNDHRANDNRHNNGRPRDDRHADDDEDGEDDEIGESSRGDPGRHREQIHISQATWNRAKEAVLGRCVIARDAPYEEWLCY